MNQPEDNGLSSNDEFQQLNVIEDVLNKAVAETLNPEFVGRITTDGHREFYYYAPDDKGLNQVVKEVNKQFPDYNFDCGTKVDPHWKQYLELLYPSDEEWQRISDRDLIEVLGKQGDDLKTPREVDHWIYFKSKQARSDFNRTAMKLGFTVRQENERPESENRPFSTQIFRVDSVEMESISEVTVQLFKLARSFDAEYDGWETLVTSSSNSVKTIQ